MSIEPVNPPAPDVASVPPGFNPWRGRLFLLALAHTVGTSCYLSIMAMGPVIREDLEISSAQFGLFMSAVFGAQLVSAMPSGALTDRMGVGWTLFGSMLLMSAGTMMFALAPNYTLALYAAFLMGLGYSFVNPATAKGVMRWFPANWRGTAMGLKQLGVPLGGVIGAGGGVLAAYTDWRNVLWAAAALTFVTALLWLPYTRKPTSGDGGIKGIIGNLRTVVTNRNMNVIFVSCVMFNTGQSSLFTYMALFLRDAAHASQPIAAMGVAFAQGASAIGRVGFSYMSDALFGSRRKPVVIGVLIFGVISFCTAYAVTPDWPHWGLMALAAFMGGTVASYAALILSMSSEAVPPALVGSAIGYNAVAWSLGGVVGPPLFGLVLDASGADYGLAWVVMAGVMLFGTTVMAKFFREGVSQR